jgi:hypothetical protein
MFIDRTLNEFAARMKIEFFILAASDFGSPPGTMNISCGGAKKNVVWTKQLKLSRA